MIHNYCVYQYIRSECWLVCVSMCFKVVTAFMKHDTSHVNGLKDGLELIDAGLSISNAVWLVAYRM